MSCRESAAPVVWPRRSVGGVPLRAGRCGRRTGTAVPVRLCGLSSQRWRVRVRVNVGHRLHCSRSGREVIVGQRQSDHGLRREPDVGHVEVVVGIFPNTSPRGLTAQVRSHRRTSARAERDHRRAQRTIPSHPGLLTSVNPSNYSSSAKPMLLACLDTADHRHGLQLDP